MSAPFEPLAPRAALPVSYRTIGPFDTTSLPAGLRAIHRLKPEVWGLLELIQGRIAFCWDDEEGGREELEAPAAVVIAPDTPHHLETDEPFSITVTFLR